MGKTFVKCAAEGFLTVVGENVHLCLCTPDFSGGSDYLVPQGSIKDLNKQLENYYWRKDENEENFHPDGVDGLSEIYIEETYAEENFPECICLEPVRVTE